MINPESIPASTIVNSLALAVAGLGVDCIQRHIFICADASKSKCVDREASLQTWEYLKKRLQELKIDRPTNERSYTVFRTKANCLRICQHGPIAVIYPDGVWYHSVDIEVAEKIIQRHILGNEIVSEYAFLSRPLPNEKL